MKSFIIYTLTFIAEVAVYLGAIVMFELDTTALVVGGIIGSVFTGLKTYLRLAKEDTK